MAMSVGGARRYQTRQRELVLECMRAHPGRYLTARQVAEALEAQGSPVGTATVYRNLDRLVEEGEVARSEVEGSGGACYRAIEHGAPACGCFYLKCEECGELQPVGCTELASFYEHFSREHRIRIDPVKTVLFGTCPSCLERGSREARGGEGKEG